MAVTQPLEALTDMVLEFLSPTVYQLIPYLQNAPLEGEMNRAQAAPKKKRTAGGAPKASAGATRESKLIPELIYNMETYERFLLQLSRKRNLVRSLDWPSETNFFVAQTHQALQAINVPRLSHHRGQGG